MTAMKQQFTRLEELERVRKNLNTYSHHNDLGPTIALALKYVGGTHHAAQVIQMLSAGLDTMIAAQREQLREALK